MYFVIVNLSSCYYKYSLVIFNNNLLRNKSHSYGLQLHQHKFNVKNYSKFYFQNPIKIFIKIRYTWRSVLANRDYIDRKKEKYGYVIIEQRSRSMLPAYLRTVAIKGWNKQIFICFYELLFKRDTILYCYSPKK